MAKRRKVPLSTKIYRPLEWERKVRRAKLEMSRTYISVDRRDCDGALQISIGHEDSHGYRIAGPKYDGAGKTLMKHFITERDAAEILSYLKPDMQTTDKP